MSLAGECTFDIASFEDILATKAWKEGDLGGEWVVFEQFDPRPNGFFADWTKIEGLSLDVIV